MYKKNAIKERIRILIAKLKNKRANIPASQISSSNLSRDKTEIEKIKLLESKHISNNTTLIDALESSKSKIEELETEKVVYSALDLINRNITEMPWLLKGILPQNGVVSLAGTSDTGKSAFLRQFAIELVEGKSTFLDIELTPRFNKCIYVSTEDDPDAMAYLLNLQSKKLITTDKVNNLKFIFETEDVIKNIKEMILKEPIDCLIVDTFTDIYSGDMNSSNKIRCFLNGYRDLALKHKFLVMFLHHLGKRTHVSTPTKDNLLGSQGFEGKMRTVLELRKDISDSSIRHLSILKGNYTKTEDKESTYALLFDENMTFNYQGYRVPFAELRKPTKKIQIKEDIIKKAKELSQEGKSIRQIAILLTEDGFQCSKSTVAGLLKKTVQCPKPIRS